MCVYVCPWVPREMSVGAYLCIGKSLPVSDGGCVCTWLCTWLCIHVWVRLRTCGEVRMEVLVLDHVDVTKCCLL